MGGADSTLDGADFTYPPGLGGLCGFVLFESVDGSGPCLLPFCPSCRPSSVLPNLPRGSWKGLWRSELQAATFPFGRRSGMCQCMAAEAIRAPQRGDAWVETRDICDPKGVYRRGVGVTGRGHALRGDPSLLVPECVSPPPSPPAEG